MGLNSTPSRWPATVMLGIALVVGFAVGWYCATVGAIKPALPAKGVMTNSSASVKKPETSPITLLARAKADLAKMTRAPGTSNRRHTMEDYAKGLNAETVKALLDGLATKPYNPLSPEEFEILMARWAELDPHAAFAWTQGLHNQQLKNAGIAQVFDVWSTQNPAEAFNALSQVKDYPDNFIARARVIENYALLDPQTAFNQLQSQSDGQLSSLYPTLFQVWASQDPSAAAAAVSNLPSGINLKMSQIDIANGWAEQDPAAALAWAKTLPDSQTQSGAIMSVLNVMAQVDPASAAANATNLDLPAGALRTDLFNTIATNWAYDDPSALLNWANQNLQGSTYNKAVTTAIQQLSASDPQSAWNYAQQLSGSVAGQAQAVVLSTWASQQPAQAAAALQNLPPGSNLDTATANVAKSWLSQDPNAATQWIDTLPAGSQRDAAVTQVISTVSENDPSSAYNLAVSLSNPTKRDQQVVQVMVEWANANPAAAAPAVQNAMNLPGLSPAALGVLQKIATKIAGP
jgi:hypothetical protein